MKQKQFLLFAKPKNYHLQFLNGRPLGMYSLRRYCFEAIRDNPGCLSYYNYDEYEIAQQLTYITFRQAVKEKIAIQKEIMRSFKNGWTKQRPVWMKQRDYWNRFKNDWRDGKEFNQYYE